MKTRLLKVLAHTGLFGIALAAILAVGAPRAYAVDPQTAQTAQVDQTANAAVVLGNQLTGAQVQVSSWVATSNIAMNLFYTGTSTEAVITIGSGGSNSANCLKFFAPTGTADTSIGSATCGTTGGAFDLGVSSTNTLGALCDLINAVGSSGASGNYHCKLVASIRDDNSSVFLASTTASTGVNNLAASGGFNIQIGTNTVISMGITPAVGRRVVLEGCVTSSQNNNFLVYGRKRGFGSGFDQAGKAVYDSALVWQSSITATTAAYVPPSAQYQSDPWVEFAQNLGVAGTVPTQASSASGAYRPFQTPVGQAAYDGHVVVRTGYVGAGSPYSNGSTNYLSCWWSEK